MIENILQEKNVEHITTNFIKRMICIVDVLKKTFTYVQNIFITIDYTDKHRGSSVVSMFCDTPNWPKSFSGELLRIWFS